MNSHDDNGRISYIVDCEGIKYGYALHSKKQWKIHDPSQILNIMEYCLYKKVKDGWKEELTRDSFKVDIVPIQNGQQIEEWEGKEPFIDTLFKLLRMYYAQIRTEKE